MTQHDIVLHKVEGRILTYLHRIKNQYQQPLYNILGRGATPEEFIAICDKLVEKGVLNRIQGSAGAPILHWIETEQITEVGHGTVNTGSTR